MNKARRIARVWDECKDEALTLKAQEKAKKKALRDAQE